MKSFGLLDDEDIARNPSVMDNIPLNKVLEHKRKSLIFVRKLGAALKLRLVSISTAQVFLHRFYSRQSFKTHDRWIVATTCVFLACKVEEDVRKLEVVLHAHVEAREQERLQRDSKEYQTLREKVLLCERILLHTMGFDISVEHPHPEGLRITKELKGKETELLQAVWNILNDSLNTDVCLLFEAKKIASAAVVLAAEFLRARGNLKPGTQAVLDAILVVEESDSIFGHDPASIPPVVEALLDAYEQGNPNGTMYSSMRRGGNPVAGGGNAASASNGNGNGELDHPAKRTRVE